MASYTFVDPKKTKDVDIYTLLLCTFISIFFFYAVIKFIFIPVTSSDLLLKWIEIAVAFILTCITAIPLRNFILDRYFPLKHVNAKVKNKWLYTPLIWGGYRHGAASEMLASAVSTSIVNKSSGGRLTQYFIKPEGWFWGQMRVTPEMYHAIEIGDQIEVVCFPFSNYVKSLTVTKSKQYIPETAAVLAKKDFKENMVGILKKVGIVLVIFFVIGLFTRKYYQSSSPMPIKTVSPAPQTGNITSPQETTKQFYELYRTCLATYFQSQSTKTAPEFCAVKDNNYVDGQKLQYMINGKPIPATASDPILCAQNLPTDIVVDNSHIDLTQGKATVDIHGVYSAESSKIQVSLEQAPTKEWKIIGFNCL